MKSKGKLEKPQGKIGPTGINKKIVKASIPQVKPGTRYGKPSQTAKM